MSEKMSQEERAIYDARASEKAWVHAIRILRPWVKITHEIGSPELTGLMERALEEAEHELNRALDVLETIDSGDLGDES